MNDSKEDSHLAKYGRDAYYRRWVSQIPYIPFDPKWDVRAVPPWGGALVRYLIAFRGAKVSVFLDGDNSLGCGPEPAYWEVYPFQGDVFRCCIDETEVLASAIKESLYLQRSTKLKQERT